MEIAIKRNSVFSVYESINRVLEEYRVVFLQSACFLPYPIEGIGFYRANQPVYSALESIALSFPAGRKTAGTYTFLQYKGFPARPPRINSSGQPGYTCTDNDYLHLQQRSEKVHYLTGPWEASLPAAIEAITPPWERSLLEINVAAINSAKLRIIVFILIRLASPS